MGDYPKPVNVTDQEAQNIEATLKLTPEEFLDGLLASGIAFEPGGVIGCAREMNVAACRAWPEQTEDMPGCGCGKCKVVTEDNPLGPYVFAALKLHQLLGG